MATARRRFRRSSVFNYQLFKINGTSMVFALNGFDKAESAAIAKIIEAFGGKFLDISRVQPNYETIVLADPNNTPGLHHYFDIQFLQDCVESQELHNLRDYCILSSMNESLSCNCERQTENIVQGTEKNCHAAKTNNKEREISDGGEGSKCQTTQKTIEESSTCSHLNAESSRNGESVVQNMNHAVGNSTSLIKPTNANDYIEDDGPVGDRNRELDKTTSVHNDSEDELRNELSEDEASMIEGDCSAARVRVYKRRPTKRINEVQTSEADDDDSAMSPKRRKFLRSAANQNQSSEGIPLRSTSSSSNSHIDASSTSSASPSSPSYTIFSDTESSESYTPNKATQKRAKTTKKGIPNHRYTEEEKRRMIQFVTDRRRIDRAHRRGVWIEFLANEPMGEPTPSAGALRWQFYDILQKRDYRKYTDDPLAIEELELLAKRKRKFWSDDERQIMIDYLVQNHQIDRVPSMDFWAQCLRVSTLLRENGRTKGALWHEFRRHLLYNYAKYTDDPEALKRFKNLQNKYPD